MATRRQSLDVSISLDRIHCIDEGDGPGNAEPYLWVLFFKIDGDTVIFGENESLQGMVTVNRRNGGHGNLLADLKLPPNFPFGWEISVDAGDDVSIPTSLGKWDTTLIPIPIIDSKKQLIKDLKDWEDFPGIIGVVCVLMEEDQLPNSAAVAGYNAFCSTFEAKMNERINSLTLLKLGGMETPDGQEEEANFNKAVKEAIYEAVESSIEDNLNAIEAIWNWVAGPDQALGSGAFSFTHDRFAVSKQIFFEDQWKEGVSVFDPFDDNWIDMLKNGPGRFITSGGEWKIFGHISATPTPQFIGTFGQIITFSQEEMAMRDFRQRAVVAEEAGFVGALPNFHTAQYGRSNVGGTIFLKPGCAVWRDVLLSELGNPPLNDFVASFRATHLYATNQAFVGGFPNFFHAEETVFSQYAGSIFTEKVKYTEEKDTLNSAWTKLSKTPKTFGGKVNSGTGLKKVTSCGTVLIKPGCAEFRDIPLAELGNPVLSDIGARFRATQDYATQHGFVGGFPNFFHADYGNGIVCGIILLTPAAAEWRDVLLWLGPA